MPNKTNKYAILCETSEQARECKEKWHNYYYLWYYTRRLSIKTMQNPIKENQERAENHTKEFRKNLFNIMNQNGYTTDTI